MTSRPPSTAGRRGTIPAPIRARSRSGTPGPVDQHGGGEARRGGRAAGAWCARRGGSASIPSCTTDPSIALGTAEVTLLELTGAYAPFANGGQGVMPHIISQGAQRRRQGALSAAALNHRPGGGPALRRRHERHDERDGDARHRQAGGDRRTRSPAARPGTTQSSRDAWFVGYTAHYVGGVWIGNDDGSPMRNVTGGTLPAKLWHDIMALCASRTSRRWPCRARGRPGSRAWRRGCPGEPASRPAMRIGEPLFRRVFGILGGDG